MFGGFGKPYIVVVSILDRLNSEDLFERISQIENVRKMTEEQMQECMRKNWDNIRRVRKKKFCEQLFNQFCFSIILDRLVIKNRRHIGIQLEKL